MANLPKENRRHVRYPITVVFDIVGSDGKAPAEGQGKGTLIDISESGAAFESESLLEPGQKVCFDIPVPVRVWANILRIRKEGVRTQYAVQFDKVRFMERMLLRRLLKKAAQDTKKFWS